MNHLKRHSSLKTELCYGSTPFPPGTVKFQLAVTLAVLVFSGLSAHANEPKVRVLCGRVLDDAGRPIAGATVEWGHYRAKAGNRETATTNAAGRYRLETRKYDADYRLGVWASGWGPTWRDNTIPDRPDQISDRNFVLRPPVKMAGQILDKKSSRPVSDLRVFAESAYPHRPYYLFGSANRQRFPYPGPIPAATTDAEGRFLLTGLPDRQSDPGFVYRRAISKPSPNPSHEQLEYEILILTPYVERGNVIPRATRPDEEPIIRINRELKSESRRIELDGVVSGQVVDKKTGQPISCFTAASNSRVGLFPFTNTAGQFVLTDLYVGSRPLIYINAEGYRRLSFRREPLLQDEAEEIKCELEPATLLPAVVVDSAGKPIAGAKIVSGIRTGRSGPSDVKFSWNRFHEYGDGTSNWANVKHATTAADGTFSFYEDCSLAVLAPGYVKKLVLWKDRSKRNTDGATRIEMIPECRITGVATMFGEHVPDIVLHLAIKETPEKYICRANADDHGRFSVGHLSSGDYVISVVRRSVPWKKTNFRREISLSPHKTLDLNLNDPGGSVAVFGEALPFSQVQLKESKARQSIATTSADADGRYRIEGIVPGDYTIQMTDASACRRPKARVLWINLQLEADTRYDFKPTFRDVGR